MPNPSPGVIVAVGLGRIVDISPDGNVVFGVQWVGIYGSLKWLGYSSVPIANIGAAETVIRNTIKAAVASDVAAHFGVDVAAANVKWP